MKKVYRPDNRLERGEYLSRSREFALRGQELPHAKLLDLQVIDIRSAKRQRDALLKHIRDNLSNAALCAKYGIHIRTLEKIISRETWSHLP
jgi:hypothetical protein